MGASAPDKTSVPLRLLRDLRVDEFFFWWDGRVTLVDRGGTAFSAQWYAGSATYRTTPNTAIMAGSAPTSFAAIRAGARAQIDYHREGTTNVADRINVTYQ